MTFITGDLYLYSLFFLAPGIELGCHACEVDGGNPEFNPWPLNSTS